MGGGGGEGHIDMCMQILGFNLHLFPAVGRHIIFYEQDFCAVLISAIPVHSASFVRIFKYKAINVSQTKSQTLPVVQ